MSCGIGDGGEVSRRDDQASKMEKMLCRLGLLDRGYRGMELEVGRGSWQ